MTKTEAIRDCACCPAACRRFLDIALLTTDATIADIRKTLNKILKNIKSMCDKTNSWSVLNSSFCPQDRRSKKLDTTSNKTQTKYTINNAIRIFLFVLYSRALRGHTVNRRRWQAKRHKWSEITFSINARNLCVTHRKFGTLMLMIWGQFDILSINKINPLNKDTNANERMVIKTKNISF